MAERVLEKDYEIVGHRLEGEYVILPNNGEFYFSYQERFDNIPRSEVYLDGKEQYKGKVAFVSKVLHHFNGKDVVVKIKMADGRFSYVDIKAIKKFTSSSKYDYKAESIKCPEVGKECTATSQLKFYSTLNHKFKNLPRGNYEINQYDFGKDKVKVKCKIVGKVHLAEIKNPLYLVSTKSSKGNVMTFVGVEDTVLD